MSYQPDEGIRKMNEWGAKNPRLVFAMECALGAAFISGMLWVVSLFPGLEVFGRIALFGLVAGAVLIAWALGVFAPLLSAILGLGSAIWGVILNARREREKRAETDAFHAKLRADHEARHAAEVTRADRQTMPIEHAVLLREARNIQTGRSGPVRETEVRGLFSDVSERPKRSLLERIVRAAGSTWRALKGAGDLVRLIGILAVLIVLYLIAAPVWRAGASLVGAMFPHETRQEAIARADRNEARAQSAENQTHIAVNVAIPQAARTMRVERRVERVQREADATLSSPRAQASDRSLYAAYRAEYDRMWDDAGFSASDGDSAPRGTGPMRPANPSPGGNASGLAA